MPLLWWMCFCPWRFPKCIFGIERLWANIVHVSTWIYNIYYNNEEENEVEDSDHDEMESENGDDDKNVSVDFIY